MLCGSVEQRQQLRQTERIAQTNGETRCSVAAVSAGGPREGQGSWCWRNECGHNGWLCAKEVPVQFLFCVLFLFLSLGFVSNGVSVTRTRQTGLSGPFVGSPRSAGPPSSSPSLLSLLHLLPPTVPLQCLVSTANAIGAWARFHSFCSFSFFPAVARCRSQRQLNSYLITFPVRAASSNILNFHRQPHFLWCVPTCMRAQCMKPMPFVVWEYRLRRWTLLYDSESTRAAAVGLSNISHAILAFSFAQEGAGEQRANELSCCPWEWKKRNSGSARGMTTATVRWICIW